MWHERLERPAGRVDAVAGAVVAILIVAASAHLSRGYFLSDDFAHIATLRLWAEQGRLGTEIASRFAGSIDGVNYFYRPLTFASFAASYLVSGASAKGWLAVNLALHAMSAGLVGWSVLLLLGARTRATILSALTASVLFFVFATGWEVALWVAGRFDALATFFTLATGVLFLSGWRGPALIATILALLSKEAGSVALVLPCVLAVLQDDPGLDVGRRFRRWLRASAPWIALGIAYALWRLWLFGTPFGVYRDANPHVFSLEHWGEFFDTGRAFARSVFPGLPGVRGLLALSAAVLVCGGVLARRRHAPMQFAAMVAMVAIALALLLPTMVAFETSGMGGRLFYQAAAFFAIATGIALHSALLSTNEQPVLACVCVACVATVVAAQLAWGVRATREFIEVEGSMRALSRALPAIAAQDGYALVIVPDTVGRVPFGRNAQAGLVLQPVQDSELSRRVLVQTDSEIRVLDKQVDDGMISVLRDMSFYEFMVASPSKLKPARFAPSRYYCWRPERREMMTLAIADSGPGSLSAQAEREYKTRCGVS